MAGLSLCLHTFYDSTSLCARKNNSCSWARVRSLTTPVGSRAPGILLGNFPDLLGDLKQLLPSCTSVLPDFELRQYVPNDDPICFPHRDTVDSDQFKREEDFYYTEVQMKEELAVAVAGPSAPGTPAADPAPTPCVTSPSLAALPLPPPKAQYSGPEHPGLESSLPSGALSKSAPGSFWHIQADHAYQVWGKGDTGDSAWDLSVQLHHRPLISLIEDQALWAKLLILVLQRRKLMALSVDVEVLSVAL